MDLNDYINAQIKLKVAQSQRRKWFMIRHDHPYDKNASPARVLRDHNYSQCEFFHISPCRIKYDAGPTQPLDCHRKLPMYMCPLCTYTTNFITSLRLHAADVHSSLDKGQRDHFEACYMCNICDFQTYSSLLFIKHKCSKTYGFSFWYCCGRCDFKSWMYDALENHVKTSHFKFSSPSVFQCGECHYKSLSETWLKKHIEQVHLQKKKIMLTPPCPVEGSGDMWRCSLCVFKTNDKKMIQKHAKEHTDLKIQWYQCGQCKFKTQKIGHLGCTLEEVREVPKEPVADLLPDKSRPLYENNFQKFENWCKESKIEEISEKVLLAYFELQKSKYKASTLWRTYSMLRSCVHLHKNVDISKYSKLRDLLKRSSEGHVPKQSNTLKEEHINRFLEEADDKLYLAMKAILIMGYNGGCRREELTNMSVDDIVYNPNSIVVTVPKLKNNIPRTFAITNKQWIDIVKKYANLRGKRLTHRRFFLTYRRGYCVNTPIGINVMGKVSKKIASFLKLPNPELFTGHCFRRSSATNLANRSGDLVKVVKFHGKWKSSAGASRKRKIEVAHVSGQESTNQNAPGCSSAPQAPSDDTTKSTTVGGESNFDQDVVGSNLP